MLSFTFRRFWTRRPAAPLRRRPPIRPGLGELEVRRSPTGLLSDAGSSLLPDPGLAVVSGLPTGGTAPAGRAVS